MLSELISPDFLFSLMLLQKLKPAHQSNAYFVLHSKILWYHFFFRLVGNLYQTYKAKSNYCLLFPSFTKKAEWIWSSKWMLPRQMIEPPFYLDNPAPDCHKPHCRCRFQAFMPTVQSDAGRCFFPLKDASNRSQPFQLYFPGHLIKPVHYK